MDPLQVAEFREYLEEQIKNHLKMSEDEPYMEDVVAERYAASCYRTALQKFNELMEG